MLRVFSGLASVALCVGVLLASSAAGLNLQTFNAYFVLPVGAFAAGALAASGLVAALAKGNAKLSWRLNTAGAVLGLLAFCTFFVCLWLLYDRAHSFDSWILDSVTTRQVRVLGGGLHVPLASGK